MGTIRVLDHLGKPFDCPSFPVPIISKQSQFFINSKWKKIVDRSFILDTVFTYYIFLSEFMAE